jgi:hypothetical protein
MAWPQLPALALAQTMARMSPRRSFSPMKKLAPRPLKLRTGFAKSSLMVSRQPAAVGLPVTVVVRVASMAAREQFTRAALMSHDNVAKFTSFVVLGEVKIGLALNIYLLCY